MAVLVTPAMVNRFSTADCKPIAIANIGRFWDPLCALLAHMEKLEFIRAGLTINPIIVERVEDILPKLQEAARSVPEAAKTMAPAAEQM